MLFIVSLLIGLAVGGLRGGRLSGLRNVRLRHEGVLLALLVLQLTLPAFRISGPWTRIAFHVWLATFPILITIAVANRAQPGMWFVGTGLACNAVVVALNGGMPVDSVAAGASVAVPVGDFVHVPATPQTWLPLLADALRVPGVPGWGYVISIGDVLLAVGVAVFIAKSMAIRTPARAAGVG